MQALDKALPGGAGQAAAASISLPKSASESDEYGVASWVYTSHRPFHPGEERAGGLAAASVPWHPRGSTVDGVRCGGWGSMCAHRPLPRRPAVPAVPLALLPDQGAARGGRGEGRGGGRERRGGGGERGGGGQRGGGGGGGGGGGQRGGGGGQGPAAGVRAGAQPGAGAQQAGAGRSAAQVRGPHAHLAGFHLCRSRVAPLIPRALCTPVPTLRRSQVQGLHLAGHAAAPGAGLESGRRGVHHPAGGRVGRQRAAPGGQGAQGLQGQAAQGAGALPWSCHHSKCRINATARPRPCSGRACLPGAQEGDACPLAPNRPHTALVFIGQDLKVQRRAGVSSRRRSARTVVS